MSITNTTDTRHSLFDNDQKKKILAKSQTRVAFLACQTWKLCDAKKGHFERTKHAGKPPFSCIGMDKNKGKYSKSSTDTPTAKYTTQACDFCKQRHLRCNGEIPCQQCLKRNQSCQFTQVNYKRGPKPRTKGKSPKKDRERDRDSNREEPQWRAKSLETDSPGYGRVFGAGGYSNAPELVADPGSEYRDTAMHYHDDSHPAYYSPSEDSHEAYQPHNTRGHPHPGEPRYQFSSLSNAGTSPMYDNPPRHGNAPLRSHKDSYPDSDYDYRNPNSTSPNYTRYPTYPVTVNHSSPYITHFL